MRERIILADALRGFALMGLFIVHMVEYFELYWYRPEPGWIHDLVFFTFGGKAYGIFALLFGFSFYIILDNHARRGVDFSARFAWRVSLLLLIGYLHSLLYAGDILQLLALCGFALLACRRLSTAWLAAIAGLFLLQLPQLALIAAPALAPSENGQQPAFFGLMAANFEVFAHGSFGELIRYNLLEGQQGKWAFFFETGRLWHVIGLMFLGAVLGRTGFFEHPPTVRRLTLAAITALAAYLVIEHLLVGRWDLSGMGMTGWRIGELIAYYQNLCLIAIEVLLFMIAFRTITGRRLLSSLAPAGRLTLTFYVAQSLVFVPAFYGFGLAWYASIGQSRALALAILFWGLQMAAAAAYTRRFRYGPLEWLWRKATLLGFGTTLTPGGARR